MNLDTHQQAIVDKNPDRWLFSWQTGTGKTLASLVLAKDKGSVLIVVPKSLKEQWQEQTTHPVLTKEEFKKNIDKLPAHNCIIIDEAHYFAGYKSKLHKSLMWYIAEHRPQHIYLLTATPYLSSVWNIYALGRILGKDWNWLKWNRYFFHQIQMGHRRISVQKKTIDGKLVEDIVSGIVNELGNTVRMDECVDLPEQTFKTEYFELHVSQKRAIENLIDIVPIVRWTKIHQICGGSLKGDSYTKDQFFKSNKLERLKDLLHEHKKAIVVCRYNNELALLSRELKAKNIFIINGKTKDKHEILKQTNDMDECVLLVQAACSEGWEAPTFPTMIFYSYDFSLKNYIQMIGRIQRINKIKKNLYLSLIVKSTIDEDVYKGIQNKKDLDIAIYEQARTKNNN